MVDGEHYEDAGPEAPVENVELEDLKLEQIKFEDPASWLAFSSLARRYGGEPTHEKYATWYKGKVLTREEFRRLVAPSKTGEKVTTMQMKRVPNALSSQTQYTT